MNSKRVRDGACIVMAIYGIGTTYYIRRLSTVQKELEFERYRAIGREELQEVYRDKLAKAADILRSGTPDEQRQYASDIEFMLY
jgi:hypothetical protein